MSFNDRRFVRNVLAGSLAAACTAVFGCSGGSSSVTVDRPPGNSGDDGGTVIVLSPGADEGGDAGLPARDAPTGGLDAGAADAAITCPSSELACNGKCVPNDVHHCGACDAPCVAPANGTVSCAAIAGSHACNVGCGMGTLCGSACTDPETDANNCGACGHACMGGACADGQCQAWTVANTTQNFTITDGPTGVHGDLVTDGKSVVWVDTSLGILQAPVQGDPTAAPTVLASIAGSDTVRFRDLAMVGGIVAWTMTDSANGVTVWRADAGVANSGVKIASLGPESASDVPRGLVLNLVSGGADAYFLTDTDPAGTRQASLYRCSVNGLSCSAIQATDTSAGPQDPNALAISNATLFWTDSNAGNIWRDDATGSVTRIATEQAIPFALAVDATDVYWANVTAVPTTGFSVMRTSQANPVSVETVVLNATGYLIAMAVDANNLYFSALGGSYLLEYTPLGTTKAKSLLDGQQAFALATGGGAVYWLNGDHTIQGVRAP